MNLGVLEDEAMEDGMALQGPDDLAWGKGGGVRGARAHQITKHL